MTETGHIVFTTSHGERVYRRPTAVVEAHEVAEVMPALEAIAQAVRDGAHAAGLLAYEAAPAFDSALTCHAPGDGPLLWFGLYDHVEERTARTDTANRQPFPTWRPLVTDPAYRAGVDRLREWIGAGDSYQVNFTFPIETDFDGHARAWYDALCRAQRADHCAYLDTGRFTILSLSPELFFELEDGRITTRPMKGTRPRGRWPAEDRKLAEDLAVSSKDRAENIMIVDLIRNDLGRICDVGTVEVPERFAIERYPSVWQMTSAVTGRTQADVPDILRALFPSGSVTGAPKVRTMQIIHEVEPHPRGVYCGTVGWWAPGGRARFNVAIRTITVDTEQRRARCNVGSGITWDSDAGAEHSECLDKARFLRARPQDFELLESLLFDDTFFLLDRHLARLERSAEYFDIPFDAERLRMDLLAQAADCDKGSWKVRVLIDREGQWRIEWGPATENRPCRVGVAATPVDRDDVLIYHKTTARDVYEDALASRSDCDDVLLWNSLGELTESTTANLVVELDGRRVTPPVTCGLLAGTFREVLIEQGQIEEAVVRLEDLDRITGIRLVNSVRKWIDVYELVRHKGGRPCATP